MAFYKDAPGKKKEKTDYASLGSWDEEGTHYGDRSSRRSDAKKDGASASARTGRTGKTTASGKSVSPRGSRSGSSLSSGRKPASGTGKVRTRDTGRTDKRTPRAREDERDLRRGNTRPVRREQDFRDAEDYRDYEYRSAPDGRERAEEQEAGNILCGRNPIREALKSGRDIEKLLVQKGELSGSAREIVQTAKANKIMVQEVEKSRLDEIALHHQGLIAFASAYAYAEVEDMLSAAEERGEEPFLILLDSVTDPHNLGAIIRTAECAGAHGVIVPLHRSVGLTPAAVKASAGAIEHVRVARVTNLNRTIEDLRKRGIWVYALAMDGEDFEKVDFRGGTALVIGAEGEGISRLTRERCDQTVALPMKGKLDSLNASVAAGIMMYRVLSCRRRK